MSGDNSVLNYQPNYVWRYNDEYFVLRSLIIKWYIVYFIHQKSQCLNNVGFIYSKDFVMRLYCPWQKDVKREKDHASPQGVHRPHHGFLRHIS